MNDNHIFNLKHVVICLAVFLSVAPQCKAQNGIAAPQNIDPELQEVISNWCKKKDLLKAIRGSFTRSIYDRVLLTEKRSEGKFYYEKMNVGRVDTYGPAFIQSDVSYPPFHNKRKQYEVFSTNPKKWVNDGKKIVKVDELKLTYETIPVESIQNSSASNIVEVMESSHPLFWELTKESIKEKFIIKLDENTNDQIVLFLTPLYLNATDTNIYRAKVVLNPKTFLPEEIQIVYPLRGQVVDLTFSEIEILKTNKDRNSWLKGFFDEMSSFQPDLSQFKQNEVVRQPVGTSSVPSVIGLTARNAELVLKRSGFKTRFVAGPYAVVDEDIFKVCGQDPTAKTSVNDGATIKVSVFSRRKSTSK